MFDGREGVTRDESGDIAMFQNRGSSPATLESSKIVDAYGLIDGHDEEVSDAPQAYTQSWLCGSETWVVLPKEYWPPHFHDIEDPVVPLDYSLYGHPDAGTFWEDKSHSKILSEGFERTGWDSLFWNKELRCLLMVYVDDFRLSGPKANLAEVWSRLRSGKNALTLDDPQPLTGNLAAIIVGSGLLSTGLRYAPWNTTCANSCAAASINTWKSPARPKRA